jgi:hypothetical protein
VKRDEDLRRRGAFTTRTSGHNLEDVAGFGICGPGDTPTDCREHTWSFPVSLACL